MQRPKRFDVGYSIGFLYAYLGLTIPHSVAVNLAYPAEIPVNGALLLQSSVEIIRKDVNGSKFRVLRVQLLVASRPFCEVWHERVNINKGAQQPARCTPWRRLCPQTIRCSCLMVLCGRCMQTMCTACCPSRR